MTLRYCPQTNGASMAQSGLRYCWKFPRAGDSAKVRAIAPCCDGASMAQTPLRAHPSATRYAPPALCLRRRLEAHRWSPSINRAGGFSRALSQVSTLALKDPPARQCARVRQGWIKLNPGKCGLGSETSISAWQTLICLNAVSRSNIKPLPIRFLIAMKRHHRGCNVLQLQGNTLGRSLCADHVVRNGSAAISTALIIEDRPDHPSRSDGAGGKFRTLGDFDIARQHTAGSFPNWARLCLENPVGFGMGFPRSAGLACAFFWLAAVLVPSRAASAPRATASGAAR